MHDRPIVLLVDADARFADSVREALTTHGYAVEYCADAEAAFARVPNLMPDLVVSDMMLPDKSGFWLLEGLKRHDHTLPVILVATLGHAPQRRLAEFLGADEFLTKPVAVNRLLEVVRRFSTPGLNPPHRSPVLSRPNDVASEA